MAILPVTGIASSVSQVGSTTASAGTTNTQFADLLNDALKTTDEADAQDKLSNLSLLAGEDVSLHTTMIEAQKAELALSLTIQIRNKVMDAYTEVMRMQV